MKKILLYQNTLTIKDDKYPKPLKNAPSMVRSVTDGLRHDLNCKAIHLNYIPELAGQTVFRSRTLARNLDKGHAFPYFML
jgi:hypothetical protein